MHKMSYYLKYWLEWYLSLKERNIWNCDESNKLARCKVIYNQLLYAGEIEEAKLFALATGLKKYYHEDFLELVDYSLALDHDLYDWHMLNEWREPKA